MDLMDLSTPNRRAIVELHIDEFVLHGFPARDGHRIAAAFERELSRLIAQGDLAQLPVSSIQLDRLDVGSFRLAPASQPGRIGRTVAQRVYSQLSPSMSATPAPTGGRSHA
jgi:hypothetical protein